MVATMMLTIFWCALLPTHRPDLKNKIGGTRENIHDKSVHKFSTDGSNTWQGYASKKETKVHTYEGTNKDHYGNQRHAVELSADNFDRMTHEYHAVIVDFHAPWCIHCRNLAPIYQHAAELVKQKEALESQLRPHKSRGKLQSFQLKQRVSEITGS